jgi:hypothetical protein
MRLFHFALLGLLLWTPSAQAKTYKVYGWGSHSCTQWSKERNESPEGKGLSKKAGSIVAWVQGYITGYNLYGAGGGHVLHGMDVVNDVALWLDNYCKDHTAKNLAYAADELIEKRQPNQVQRKLLQGWRTLDAKCRSDLEDASAKAEICKARDTVASELRKSGCQYDGVYWTCTPQ